MNEEREILIRNINTLIGGFLETASLRELRFVFAFVREGVIKNNEKTHNPDPTSGKLSFDSVNT